MGTAQDHPGRHHPHPDVAADDGSPGRRLYISGDTLLVEELNEIPARFDPIDVGVLHLAGTRPPARGAAV